MEYVVGSVAALISGNVTPNRPKLVRKALTPIKHQPSPNVTPKSEFVEDRSIFLSPTLQKKKAIVKKSPKRIFENPDLDVTSENEGTSTVTSPKADKVKKHLNDELEADRSHMSPKSPKNKKNKSLDMSVASTDSENNVTPKKKKGKSGNEVAAAESIVESDQEDVERSPKKSKKRLSLVNQNAEESPNKNNKKRTLSESNAAENTENNAEGTENKSQKKKNKKQKKKQKKVGTENVEVESKKSKNKPVVNPNAITDKDTDSEHESDDEIESENEEANKEMLDTGPAEGSSDEEEEEEATPKKKIQVEKEDKSPASEDEVKRTLFVGNVPFTKKCKKEVKKIFSKYGAIETVRIRTVPIKDPRFTPKLAVIKNELHPERSTVNVYVKFKEEFSVEQALVENNTVLNEHHLRVTRSACSGAEHDPRRSVFVGNLPFGLEDDAFRDRFRGCGQIESVRIIRDKKTNAGKGFGYINFASKDGVELALNLTEEDLTIKNRILRVKRCVPSRPGTNPGHSGAHAGHQGQGNKGFVRRNDSQGGMRQGGKFQGQGNFQGGRNQGGFQGRNQGGFHGRNQGGFQGRNQGGFQGRNQGGFQGRNQGSFQGRNQGGFQGRNQGGFQDRNQGNAGGNNKEEGAYRRILHKRKGQEGEGPPDKKGKFLNQPQKEKKPRKEFVGMTAEKKKKHTFNKGQKKKKILSEILANK